MYRELLIGHQLLNTIFVKSTRSDGDLQIKTAVIQNGAKRSEESQ
ncbi:hypothetical protein M2347_002853 [Chryseobacterium sp. H1D6B]|nr:hypothetical protein [Chryseobacterium sp. H1D6B]MDH6253126.1 hypothetical protein [Chryseobacterium sp. H1D6B]